MQRKQENSVTDLVSVGKKWWKPTVRDVNPYIVCGLCDGYLVDATTVTKCLHSYCRSCLLSYIRNTKYQNCPSCRDQFKISLISNYRRDLLLQRLVYKMVPGLYRAVVRRKQLFRDNSDIQRAVPLDQNKNCLSRRQQHERSRKSFDLYTGDEQINVCLLHWDSFDDSTTQSEQLFISGDTCYLQCPTGLTISHLKKYLRLKFGIEDSFEIDLFVGKGCVPDTFTLVDVAYCFFAKRVPEITLSYVVVTDGRKAIGPRQTKGPALTTTTTPPPPRLCTTSPLQQPQQLNGRRTSRATSLTSTTTTTAAAATVRETPRRDPTARLRKRMINNNFERRRRRPTTTTSTATTITTTATATTAVTASPQIPLTDHQYLRKLIDDYGDVEIEITEIVNDVDSDVEPSDHQLPADVIQADSSLVDDCEPLLIDDDDVVDERLPMVDTRLPNMCIETERDDRTLSAILDDNLNDVMAAALGTLVTDSAACVLSVSELEVDNSASSDQWIEARAKSGTVLRQSGEDISDQLIVELVSTAGSRDDSDEAALSDASSDIDGEIRKIAANVTCNSNNDDDINSVSDEDERRCGGIPAMSSPYPENSLEPTVGVDDLSSSSPPTVLTDDHDVVITGTTRVCNIISGESSKGLGLENINCEMITGDSSSSVVRDLTICGDSPGSGAVATEQSIGILARGSSSFGTVCSDTGNSGNRQRQQDHAAEPILAEVGSVERDSCGELSSSSSDSCRATIGETRHPCNLDDDGKLCSDNGEKSRFSPETAKQLEMDCVKSLQGTVVDRKASLVVPVNSGCVSRLTVKTSVDCGVPSPSTGRLVTPPGAKNGQLVADDVMLLDKQGQPCGTSAGSRRSSRSDSSSGYSSSGQSSSSSMDALSPGSAASDSLSPVSGFQQLITTCVTKTTTSAPVSRGGQSVTERNSIGTQTNTDLLGRYFKRQNKPVNSFLPPGSATKYTRASTIQTIGSPCRRDSSNLGFKDRILRTTGGLKTVQSSSTSSSSIPPSMFIRAHTTSAFKTSASSLSLNSSTNLNGSSVGTTAVLLTSGQQGSAGSILLPVPSVSPINNNNNKGTFLIALPVNFSLSSSISGGIVCPTISVPSLGGISKVVPAAGSGVLQTGSSLTVCPLIVKALPSTTANRPAVSGSVQLNNRSTVAPFRMSLSVANSSATNDMHCLKTSVAAAPAPAGNTTSSSCRTTTVILAAAAKCSSQPSKLQSSSVAIVPCSTTSAATPPSSNQVARTYSGGLSGQVVVAATGDNRQVASIAGNDTPTTRNDAASESQSSVAGCSSSSSCLRSVLSGSSRSSGIQGTSSNCQVLCNVQGQGPVRDAISARQHQQQLPNGNSCWSSQSSGSKSTCIVVVTGQPSAVVGQTGAAVTVSSSLSQAAVARHSAMASLPQLSLTASRKTLPVACSSSAFSSFCPVRASSTSSSVSANTNGDSKAPDVTASACSYIRKILESDLVSVSNGDVGEKREDEGRRLSDMNTNAVGLKGHLAVRPMTTNQASTSLALLCSTKTGRRSTLQQQSSTQPSAPSTALKRPSIDSSHVTAVTKRSRPMQQLSTDSSTTSAELGSVMNGMESADGSQLERVAMATICSDAQQTANVTNNSSSIGPSGGPAESWIQARTTRVGSGMVALPKKVYTYLGSAMSHEHIAASQLVRGSPSPPSNSSSLDGSDVVCSGLVPSSTSPTTIACSPAAGGRLSNESLLTPSTDDGPIRQLRLMCKHVA